MTNKDGVCEGECSSGPSENCSHKYCHRLRENSCLVLTGWWFRSPNQMSLNGMSICQGKVRVEVADADLSLPC